jgi:hypothetical protein
VLSPGQSRQKLTCHEEQRERSCNWKNWNRENKLISMYVRDGPFEQGECGEECAQTCIKCIKEEVGIGGVR